MIRYFYATEKHLRESSDPLDDPEGKLVWVDLFMPDQKEISKIDNDFSLELPTREEMREIEISSRLYEEEGALYMTVTYLSNGLLDNPEITQLTFILKGDILITKRYREMRIINFFIEKTESKGLGDIKCGRDLLVYILDNFIDLCADVLEKNHAELEKLSRKVFKQEEESNYKLLLNGIASIGDLNSKVRETLVSLNRTVTFWNGKMEGVKAHKDTYIRLKSMSTDIVSLLDHAAFVSGKISFLLDAVLGFVNLEQNAIIKIFSVATVISLPPTLISCIYGMNFHYMPELQWEWGYPLAMVIMLLSAILPYWYFKYRKWL